MNMYYPSTQIHLIFLLLSIVVAEQNLVQTSCANAAFPDICLHTLSSYSGPANTPRDLANAALNVSLSHANKASGYLTTLKAQTKREHAALVDCVKQVVDSIDELKKSLKEIESLHGGTLRWQMSNVETWVSAALTNDDSCLDGFKEIGRKVRDDVKGTITDVARVTSNALYFINLMDQRRKEEVLSKP